MDALADHKSEQNDLSLLDKPSNGPKPKQNGKHKIHSSYVLLKAHSSQVYLHHTLLIQAEHTHQTETASMDHHADHSDLRRVPGEPMQIVRIGPEACQRHPPQIEIVATGVSANVKAKIDHHVQSQKNGEGRSVGRHERLDTAQRRRAPLESLGVCEDWTSSTSST